MSQSPIELFIDAYRDLKKKKKNPLLQLMKSVVARLFRHQLSEILDTHPPPSNPLPHQTPNPLPQPLIRPWITRTEISGSTMYSNLVWIMCCSLGFLK